MNALRSAFRIALVAIAAEAVLAFGIGLATPGHDMARDYVSSSSAVGSRFAGLGFLMGMLGAALHLQFVRALWDRARTTWSRLAAVAFAGFFGFIAASALFQCDPGCAVETTEALVHTILGIFAFASLGIAALLQGIGTFLNRTAPLRGPLLAAAGFVVVADLALLLGHTMNVYPGFVERWTVVAMWIWTVVLYRAELSVPASLETQSTRPR